MSMLYVPKIKNIGRYSYSAPDIMIANPRETTIGSFVSIGNKVSIGHGIHPQNYLSTSPYLYLDRLKYKRSKTVSHNEWEELPPVHIGNDVWIGNEVMIKNGITIGDGAIIGSKTLITKDVPPYAIVYGIPGEVKRYRFSAEIIEALCQLKWWELSDKIIRKLPYDDIEDCLKELKKIRNL